jgi:hypothetical protein
MGSSLFGNSLSPDSFPKLTLRKQLGGITSPVRQEVALKNRVREWLHTPCRGTRQRPTNFGRYVVLCIANGEFNLNGKLAESSSHTPCTLR